MAALQAFEVIGQLHHAAHQRRACVVALGDLAAQQRQREAFHFLGNHRRGVQLDHAQRAVHLVHVPGADAHVRGLRGIFGKRLDLLACLAQRGIELGLDPAQRRRVDRVAQHGHRFAPCRRAATTLALQAGAGAGRFAFRPSIS